MSFLKINYAIIFDNGGGVTLQLNEFAHHYACMDQAADDLKGYLKDQNTSEWEGHEPEALECDPTDEDINNGGYRVYNDVSSIKKGTGWANIDEFFKAYKKL